MPDQPGRTIPSFPMSRPFQEGSQHCLGEGASLTADVFVRHRYLVDAVLDVDLISRGGSAFGAIGEHSWTK